MSDNPRIRRRQLSGPSYDSMVVSNADGVIEERPMTMSQSNDVMQDVVTPGYHKRVAQGEIINNPCSYEFAAMDSSGGSYLKTTYDANPEIWTEYDGGSITSYHTSWPPPIDLDLGDVEGDAKVRALAQIDRTPFAFGEDLLELRETLRFIRSPLSSIRHLVDTMNREARKAVRGSGSSSKSIAKAIADVYATGRFALTPLVKSIYDAAEAYDMEDFTRPERLNARGFASGEDKESETVNRTTSYSYDVLHEKEASESGHAHIMYSVSNPIYDMRFRLGLRAKDFPLTLWQIMPLSFMVDRLANVSTAVQAATNILDPSIKVLAASYTRRTTVQEDWTVTACTRPGYSVVVTGDTVVHKNFDYQRKLWKPSLSDVQVPWNPGELVKDVTAIADLVAIITQRLR